MEIILKTAMIVYLLGNYKRLSFFPNSTCDVIHRLTKGLLESDDRMLKVREREWQVCYGCCSSFVCDAVAKFRACFVDREQLNV